MRGRLRIAMLGTRGVPTTYGGVERAVEELSAGLAKRGHHVVVYCRSPYADSRRDTWRGVRLRYVPTVNTKHLEAITHTTLATLDALGRDFDVIHFHATGPALLSPLARLGRARVFVTVQGLDYRRAKWGLVAKGALRAGASIAGHVPHTTIVVSRELQRFYTDEMGCETLYIPNGVELPSRSPGPPPFGLEPARYVLFLGRLVPEKGIDVLIDAYRRVKTDYPLVIAGPSSHSDTYVRALESLAESDSRVRFVGAVYGVEKDALFAHATAFVQPSYLEGLPIALLEALSWSRCAIVSDLPEHREIIDPGGGIAFRAGDPDALAVALSDALSQPVLRDEYGRLGRQRVEQEYSWERIVGQLETAYFAAC